MTERDALTLMASACQAREAAMERLKAIIAGAEIKRDPEGAHVDADQVLCDLLRALGCGDVVEAYDQIEKWYA